jgi:proteasome lid subunit RPN8/RPN11
MFETQPVARFTSSGNDQMTQANEPIYAAIITISLPETAQSTTINVALTPGDVITTNGRVKPLGDCTLADLQIFANTLEAEVWQTYQAIKLIDLADDEEAQVEVTLTGEVSEGQDWRQQNVVLPGEKPVAEATAEAREEATAETTDESDRVTDEPAAEEEIVSTTATHAVSPAATTTTNTDQVGAPAPAELKPPPGTATTAEPEVAIPNIVIISETQPVHPEREAPPESSDKMADAATLDTPIIAPSKARVLVAGRRRPLGHSTWTAVDILVDEPALRAAQAHALSSPDREVAGVLIGPPPEKQPDGRYVVHVIDTIIAKYTVMHGASVTYTPESWRYLNDKLAERYPDETAVMVGWYHTHPGFGIFLSGMDKFIHQNFFTQIWHVAFVLDPLAHKSGFFCWDRHKSRVAPYEFPWPAWAAGSW